MVTSVEKRAFEIYYGIARKYALFNRFFKSFIYRRNKLTGNYAADYRVDEFVNAVFRARLEANFTMSVLTRAARLFLIRLPRIFL